MIKLTLSFTDSIEVSSLTEKFQHFSAAVPRIYVLREGCVIFYCYNPADIKIQKQKSDLICGKKIYFGF